jgi:hypothetical protein
VMEKGSERFDAIEQCLEERATVIQLSELSAKLDKLVSRVEDLEDENKELKAQVCTCDKYEARVVPKEESDDGLSYATPEEESIRLPVPIAVLPAVSGQRCKPSRGLPLSRRLFPSLSPGRGVARTATKIRSSRMEFTKVVSGLQSTRDRLGRVRRWRQAAENAVDPGYLSSSEESDATDWDSLGRSSVKITDRSSDLGPIGGGSVLTDRSIGLAPEEGGNRCGLGCWGRIEYASGPQGGFTSCHNES